MKDARRETSAEEEAAKRPGTHNEEKSRTVESVKPEDKETKMANPKAVMPDGQRLGTEVSLHVSFPPLSFGGCYRDGELTIGCRKRKSQTL